MSSRDGLSAFLMDTSARDFSPQSKSIERAKKAQQGPAYSP